MSESSRSEPSDAILVAAAQRGDRRALETLLERHHDRVRAVCWRLTGNAADADDATQEALIAVVRGLPRFDGRSAFTTWLFRIATNASLDELRRRRRRPVPDPDQVDRLAASAAVGAGIETVAERDVLDRALRQLPEEYRIAVVLRDVGDLDYAEIAEVLQIPPGTVRSRIARGRASLAAALGGNQTTGDERPRTRP
jgi:RNA polymerase sigma-70 factor (ECF subfamily)